jgi:hypothetical protein
MKKWIASLTLCSFCLYANQAPSQNSNTEEPAQTTTSPTYAAPKPSVEKKEEPQTRWKMAAAVIGTIATVTLGLFMSGRNTGKHYEKPAGSHK